MNEVEEDVPGERRPEKIEAIKGAVDGPQDEDEVAPEHHDGEKQHEFVEGRAPLRQVPVSSDAWNEQQVRQVAEMQVSDSATTLSRWLR